MAVTRKIRHKEEDGTVVEVDIGTLAENVTESDDRMFVTAAEKEKLGAQSFAVVLLADGWTEASGKRYTQTVQDQKIRSGADYIMSKAPDASAGADGWEIYSKAYNLVASGNAIDSPMGGLIFTTFGKKPDIDVPILLKEV